jgi:hypothetical protein
MLIKFSTVSVIIAVILNPYYHTAGDTMDKLDFEFMAGVVESLVIFFLSHQK